jgi:glycosyltransferase involved in cell wall biosynthesis
MATRILGWPAFSPRTGNAYNALLYDAVERRGALVDEFSPARLLARRYDVWHIHWPERLAHGSAAPLRVAVFAALVLLARLRGTRIVWTVHNLEGHLRRRPRLERRLMRWLSSRLDGVIALSESGAEAAADRYPALRRAAGAVIPHGHYIDGYANTVGRSEARAVLAIEPDERVAVFVGRIAPYKDVERLVREFGCLHDPRARLVVAGHPATAELQGAIEGAAAGDPRVQLHLREVEDLELQVFLNAAHVVVLPYERVLNSGSALLALSFGRPVLVPALGAMDELRSEIGADAVYTFEPPLVAAHLHAALDAAAPHPEALIERLRAHQDWDGIAERTLALYRKAAA